MMRKVYQLVMDEKNETKKKKKSGLKYKTMREKGSKTNQA
jgi:hypothetical protein